MSTSPSQGTALGMMKQYFLDFAVLKDTRKEFWGIQLINILDCTIYFAMLTIASLFLSADIGLSDAKAGYVIAAFTSLTTIMLTMSGAVSDWLGIRKSLRLSMIAMLVLRLGVVFVGVTPGLPMRGVLATVLLVLMAPFMAGIQTVFQSSCKRFTTKKSRSAGFNLWYLFMNIGAALGGYSVDVVRLNLKVANVHIFTMGVGLALLCLVVGEWMIRNEAQLESAEEAEERSKETPELPKAKRSPFKIIAEVVTEPAFARLMVLIALTLGVRAVYAYLYLLMPKYWERTIGADAAIGALNMINPIGIVIGLILFIPIANRFNVFSMLVYGAIVSALSLLPLALPWQMFGADISHAHYVMAIVCMVVLTIGEVLWSPKLYEFTAAIAPKGQEGTYLGLSMIPWFLAKTLASLFSGHMLSKWSPEQVSIDGVSMPLKEAMVAGTLPYWQTPAAMWLILGVIAIVGCLIALSLRGWLTAGADWNRKH